jgi:hypothetical protein
VVDCPPPDERSCLYDVEGGTPRPVPGAEPGWIPIGWDQEGWIFFRDPSPISRPVKLRRLDPHTGATEEVAGLGPRDTAGYFTVFRAFVTPDAGAWAYTVIRHQSDLFVATGLE